MTKRFMRGSLAATLTALTIIVSALPAHASTVTNAGFLCTSTPGGFVFSVTPSSVTGAVSGDTFVVQSRAAMTASVTLSGVSGSDPLNSTPTTYTINTSSPAYIIFTITAAPGGNCVGQSVTISINGGGGGGGSPSVDAPAPQTFELSLNPHDGTTCTDSSESGTGGTWITLPSTVDCTPPVDKPGATLLGWSTSPDFPIAIAQRQVTNGWGTYETFNEAGRITSVFIPAGRATLISGTNTLYPIWNK